MNEKTFATAKDLREGNYLLIDDLPCRIVEIESSKSGKHGAHKLRITGIGIFDGAKKVMLAPGDSDVEVPIIDRKNVQIMSINGKVAQVMDSNSYEMYDMEIPQEMLAQAAPGKEAEVIEAMGKRKVERIR